MRAVARLPMMRARAQSLMTATFEAFKPNGVDTDADGSEFAAYVSQGTTPGKVQGTSAIGKDSVTRSISVGDVDLPVIDSGLHIPLSSFVVAGVLTLVAGYRGTGWELVCTSAGTGDPAIVGRRFLVVNAPAKSYATARRLDVVEVPTP